MNAEVWALEVPAADSPQELDLTTLDREEHRRIAAFRRREDQVRYGFAHMALRAVLAPLTGLEPHELRFLRQPCPQCAAPHGRPALESSPVPLEFSLSHGGSMVLIATADVHVGIDVEPVPGSVPAQELTRMLHADEQAALRALPAAARAAAFARVWTRKEAYLKGVGVGLGRDLAMDNVLARIPGWQLTDLPLDPAHAGALALASPALRAVRLRRSLHGADEETYPLGGTSPLPLEAEVARRPAD